MFRSIKKFIRFKILITCYAIAFIGSAASNGVTLKTVLILSILCAWYIHAASSNDYSDRFIDEVNLKDAADRPLISKDISFKQLWVLHASGGLLALLLSVFYGWQAVVFTLIILLFDYAYSVKPVRISDRGILSQLILPLAYVAYPFTLGYLATPTVKPYPLILALGLYLGFVARLFLKDFRDVKGDRLHGKMTFLLRHGVKKTCMVSAVFGLLSLAFIGFATDFMLGIGLVLLCSQIMALLLLRTLSKTSKIEAQLQQIAQIARIANSAVLAALAYLLCKSQTGLSNVELQIIPGVLGITLLVINQLYYTNMTSKRQASINKPEIKFPRLKQLSMPSFFQHFAWTWMRPFMIIFCRAKIRGRKNLKGIKSNVIIASNHSNELDPIFIVASLSFFSSILPISYVSRSKDFYVQMPRGSLYGGKFFELMGAYPVYPGLKNYEKSLQNQLEAVKRGLSVGIFPIGRRHSMSEISQARGGVSYLAYKTGLPVIPVRIDGVNDLKLVDCLKLKSRMTVTFGKPLYAKDIFGKNVKPKTMESHKACEKAAIAIMKKIARL